MKVESTGFVYTKMQFDNAIVKFLCIHSAEEEFRANGLKGLMTEKTKSRLMDIYCDEDCKGDLM